VNPTWDGRKKLTAEEREAAYAEEDAEREAADRHREWVNEQHSKRLRSNVTDRALRYRANQEPPEGERRCCMCGSRKNVEIEHINGFEEDNDQANKMWACRSCNTRKGIALRNAGLGRRTKQYNPAAQGATTLAQWVMAVMTARGESDQMSVRDAVAMIRATPQYARSQFAHEIWERRRARSSDSVPF
jgi:hypothetical protein